MSLVEVRTKKVGVFNHTGTRFCVPVKRICNVSPLNPLITTDPNDTDYCMAVKKGSSLDFQFHLPNNKGGKNVEDLVTAEIVMNDSITPTTIPADTLQMMSGHTNDIPYQTVRFNANIEGCCFYIKFNLSGNIFYSQKMTIEDTGVVEMEGEHTKDCIGDVYYSIHHRAHGTELTYSNKIALRGKMKYFGGNTEDNMEIVRFYGSEPVPGYLADYVLKKILKSRTVQIDGKPYEPITTILEPIEGTCVFQLVLEFKTNLCQNEC